MARTNAFTVFAANLAIAMETGSPEPEVMVISAYTGGDYYETGFSSIAEAREYMRRFRPYREGISVELWEGNSLIDWREIPADPHWDDRRWGFSEMGRNRFPHADEWETWYDVLADEFQHWKEGRKTLRELGLL